MNTMRVSRRTSIAAILLAVAAFAVILPSALHLMGAGTAQANVGGGSSKWLAKFEGVEGDVQDSNYIGWTDITSVNISMVKPGEGMTGTTHTRGDVKLNDITVTKELDSSTVPIFGAAVAGKVFPIVEIHLTTAYENGRQSELEYELINVSVSNYSISGDGEEPPMEEFALNYEGIKVTHADRDDTGRVIARHEFGWDVIGSREIK